MRGLGAHVDSWQLEESIARNRENVLKNFVMSLSSNRDLNPFETKTRAWRVV